ncbi:RHS repeat-associated core domain-containing protein [Pseudomonas sp. S37]|uniref:RHS repeat-associated core domain-containing protein n=1 Tax=Pseudomonas sp. S37 TaxID=2767449 RepID=UPI0019141A4E|nr:RHS repeat-associated core domain-containing protein [Pseudomonas sp. S37]MBK4993984.1 RHS repeat-associated core domain-containing protein [Pseudomonas sp. S37]
MTNHIWPIAVSYSPYGYECPESRQRLLGFCGYWRVGKSADYPLGNGYRLFTAGLMRFRSPDVASPFEEGGINAYAYCNGDPINRVDRTGRAGTGLTALLKKNKLTLKLKPFIKQLEQGKKITVFRQADQSVSQLVISSGESGISIKTSQQEQVPAGDYLNRKNLYILWRNEARSSAITLTTGFKLMTVHPPLPNVTLQGGGSPLAQANIYSEFPSPISNLRSVEVPSTNYQHGSTSRR